MDQFVENKIQALQPRFAHRRCRVTTRLTPVPAIWIPADVLDKIVEGLVRNAVENTPDGGRIIVAVREGKIGPELEINDNGVGITAENQRLIFDNYFTAYETMQYSSRKPYDFGAGGKGFDLLRMRIFCGALSISNSACGPNAAAFYRRRAIPARAISKNAGEPGKPRTVWNPAAPR